MSFWGGPKGLCQHSGDSGTGTGDKWAPVCSSKPIFLLVWLVGSTGGGSGAAGTRDCPVEFTENGARGGLSSPKPQPSTFRAQKKVESDCGALLGVCLSPNPGFPCRRAGLRAGHWRRGRSGLTPPARLLQFVTFARRFSPRTLRDTRSI